ncbi:MAG: 7TM diverse intracellular signaling domain-containing protein, partial [Runella sp.]
VRMRSFDAQKIQFKLIETHRFYTLFFDELWFWTTHIGFVLCMIIVQVIFMVVTKERNFFFYVLFLLGYLLIAIVGGYGVVDHLIWPHNTWLQYHGIIIAVVLSNLVGVLFYINVLQLKVVSPFLYQLLVGQGVLVILTSFVIFSFFPHIISPNVYSCVVIAVFFALVSVSCIIAHRLGNPHALYYLFGTLAYVFGIFIVLLWTLSYIEPNILTVNAMHIGSMIEMTCFTWALAKDYKRTREEREETQKQFIESLKSQNEEISQALLRGQTIERKRVAADLHDSLGGTLSALRWTLSALNPNNLPPQEKQIYDNLVEMTNDAHQKIRFLSHNLLPEDLDREGLQICLERFVEKLNRTHKTYFLLEVSLPSRLSPKIEFEAYSICLELINNIIKHAEATEASLKIIHQNHSLLLAASDNGKGIDQLSKQGKGLQNIQDRVSSLGGTWVIQSLTQGTQVEVQIPLNSILDNVNSK